LTSQALSNYIRSQTRTSTVTLTDADLLILANMAKDRLILRALETNEDLFLVPTYENLVASTTTREYPLHSTILSRIKRVEAKLDGTNWIKLKNFDLTDHSKPVTTEANITYYFSNDEGNAFYDLMRKALWIYSGTISAVTDGLRIWVNTWPADFTDMTGSADMSVDPSTTTHGFPRELHDVLATEIIVDWKGSREKPIPLTEREVDNDRHIEIAIQSLKKADYDREIKGKVPYNDGSNY